MQYFPAKHSTVALAGLEHARAPFAPSRTTALLALACAFAAGFNAATWFIAYVIIRTP